MSGLLIIIRGNSGSGKTTISTRLRREMGYGTMLIPQDVVRRDIMRVQDEPYNPAIDLISEIALFGNKHDYDVIIEGILSKEKYGEMLKRLIEVFDRSYVFYMDVSFNETIKRHQTKANKAEFGENEMRAWWIEKDYLGTDGEIILHESLTEDEIIGRMKGHL